MTITIDNTSESLQSPAIIGKQNEIINVLSPSVNTAKGEKAATASWDNEGAFDLGSSHNYVFVDIYVSENAYIILNNIETEPTINGAIYAGGITHRLPCRDLQYIHYKRAADTNSDIYVSAWGN